MVDPYKLKITATKAALLEAVLEKIDLATAAIEAITPNLVNLDSVADNIDNVNAAATNESNINAAVANEENINALVAMQTEFLSIYADKLIYATLYSMKTELDSIYADKATLDSIYADKVTLDALYTLRTTLSSLFSDKDKLTSIYNDKATLDSIYENMAIITTNAENIEDIQTALSNAQAAASSASAALGYRNEAEGFRDEAEAIAGGSIVSTSVLFGDLTNLETYRTNTDAAVAAIQAMLASDDTTLDEFQELVSFIKANREDLDALAIANIAGLQDALDAKTTELLAHTNNTSNPHAVTKTQIGLSNVDNTSDLLKPISTAAQAALDLKQATLVSGTNIKTLNGASLLGSSDIDTFLETVYTLSGTAMDKDNGTIQTITFSANTTLTSSLSSGESITLHMINASSYTITFPTITWVTGDGNTLPEFTSSDVIVIWNVSGTLYGAYVGSGV